MKKWMSGGSGFGLLVAALALSSAGCSGEDGAPGEAGPQGEPGPMGAQGTPGETGATGEAGPRGDAGPEGEPGDPGEEGSPGAKGDTGVKGDTGDTGEKGDAGPAGFFVLKDGAGASLGTIISFQQGFFLVRGPQGALVYYALLDGSVFAASGRRSDPLYFVSTDCSGAPLVSATLVDASAINDGKLYKAALPYANVTRHSEMNDETGLCVAATSTEPLMAAVLVGAAPPTAVMPLTVE